MKPKLNWRQSTFVENCPIYYVLVDERQETGKTLMRIEYVFGNKITYANGAEKKDNDYWMIEVLGGIKIKVVDNVPMSNANTIKREAEKLFQEAVAEMEALVEKTWS